jgi:hypothetical protein
MRTSKLLAFLAAFSVVLIAGCNKNESWLKGPDSGNSALMPLKSAMVTTVPLGSAATFAVLGGTTVTTSGPSLITGDLGVSPGTAITGFRPVPFNRIEGPGTVTSDLGGIVTGTIYAGGPVAALAHNDATIAYNYLIDQVPTTQYLDIVNLLGGLTLTPGIYNYPSAAHLDENDTLYLDFGGDPNALFIFQVGSELVMKTNSKIVALNNPDQTCLGSNVFWAVGSSATIDGDSFIGTVIAFTAITMTNTGNVSGFTNVSGRMLALGASVTMVNSIISTCGTSGGGTVNPPHKPPKPCRDFVTGGGWINDKETFGVTGGIKNGKFWGQLSYNNHDGVKVKSTEVTGYTYINATTREIKGHAKVNGKGSFDYTVVVADKGEPGRHDTFSLVVSNGFDFSTSGTLEGGNIQLHKECRESRDKNKEDYYDNNENDGNRNCDNDHWRR